MKIIKNLIVGLLLLSFGTGLKAQYTTVGQGVFGGTVAGPVRLSVTDSLYFSHYAYIYPSSLISGLQHGDTIQSFEFSTLAGFVPLSGVNIDVYARNTTATDFGAAPRKWDNLRSASKLVHAGSLVNIIDGTAGFKKFEVNNNPWVYDTTKGKNIEILVDYRQTQRQAGLVQFDYDNTNLIPHDVETPSHILLNDKYFDEFRVKPQGAIIVDTIDSKIPDYEHLDFWGIPAKINKMKKINL